MTQAHDFSASIIRNLVAQEALTEKQGKDILTAFLAQESEEAFENYLLDEGFVEKEDLLRALSKYYKTPAFDANGVFFEHQYVHMFPKDVMLRNNFIPLDVEDEIMTIVASHPTDPQLPELINSFVSYSLIFLVGFASDIDDAVKEYYDQALTIDDEIIDDEESDDERAEHDAIDEISGISHPHDDYED